MSVPPKVPLPSKSTNTKPVISGTSTSGCTVPLNDPSLASEELTVIKTCDPGSGQSSSALSCSQLPLPQLGPMDTKNPGTLTCNEVRPSAGTV